MTAMSETRIVLQMIGPFGPCHFLHPGATDYPEIDRHFVNEYVRLVR